MSTTMKLIAKQTLGSNAASVTFSDIPGTYTDLLMVYGARSARTGNPWDGVKLNINGTGATGLSTRSLYGIGTGTGSNTDTNGAGGMAVSDSATSNTFSNASVYVSNYAGASAKSISVESISENNASSAVAWAAATLWNNTSAITSIQLSTESSSNLLTGSSFFLYGITKA